MQVQYVTTTSLDENIDENEHMSSFMGGMH
jgi:hypothetical protein